MIENTDNSNIENEDVDLVMLVDAIRSSSNAELAVLSNISTTIAEVKELLSKSGELDKKLHKMADKEHRVWRRTNRQNVTPKQNKPTSDKRAKPPAKPTNKRPGEAELVISRPSQVKPPSLPEVPESIARPADIEQRDIKTVADSVEQMEASTTKAMNELSKYWRDEKGRLRKPSGQYASKAEKEAYEKNAQETAQEREEEKRNSALTTILTKGKDVIGKTSETDAAEAGGAAAGGTYFYAVKETVDLLNSTKEKIDELRSDDENGEKTWLGSLFQKLLKKEDAQPTKTEKAKEASNQRQQKELLQEQNAQQIRDADTTHRKLDDVVSAIRASSEEGLLDGVMDMTSFMDDALDIGRSRGGRGGGRGRSKGGRGRTGRRTGSTRMPGRRGARGPQSILERFRNTTSRGAEGAKQMGKGFWQSGKEKFSHAKTFAKSGASKGTDLLKSVSPKSILKVGGPLAAVVGGLDKFLSVKDDDSLSTEQKTAQVASTAAGGGLGTTIGAAIGATLGSIVPGLGTAAGGFVGGAIGGGVGTLIGSDIGETISDFIGSDSSLTEYVSNAWDSATAGASEMLDFASEGAEKALDHVSDVFDDVSDVLKDTKSTIASWFSGDGSQGNASKTINHAAGETTTPMASTTPVVGYPVVNLEQSASITESEKKELFKESISEKPLTVSLDEKSLQALQNAGVNAAVQTSNPNVTVKTAEAKGTRNIPDDFTTRELRRQSADMD